MSIAESGSRIRIPGDGNEVQTGTEVEFTDEICCQTNQKICRAALSENENSGFRKQTLEGEIIERSVELCGPNEHHAMKKDCVLSPESDELSDEQLDDDNLFEDISDTDFSDVEEFWCQRCEKRDTFCREFELSSMRQRNCNGEQFWWRCQS